MQLQSIDFSSFMFQYVFILFYFISLSAVAMCLLQKLKLPTLERHNSCGSTRPFPHGKVRLYPWEVCVLYLTSIPTVKLPMGNHYGYIKKNKRITHDVSRTKS